MQPQNYCHCQKNAVYLRTSPETCMRRIASRNRYEEQGISQVNTRDVFEAMESIISYGTQIFPITYVLYCVFISCRIIFSPCMTIMRSGSCSPRQLVASQYLFW